MGFLILNANHSFFLTLEYFDNNVTAQSKRI